MPNLETRLVNFCDAARFLAVQPSPPQRPGPAVDVLANIICKLRDPLSVARSRGSFLNPWISAGLKRNEVRNSAVLADLIRPNLGGDGAKEFLKSVLRRVEKRAFLPCDKQISRGYKVACEQCPMGDSRDRIDLLIEGEDFVLGIEVKIDAKLGDEQLERYFNSLEKRTKSTSKQMSLVFLAPFPPPDKLEIGALTWKSVAAAARDVMPKRTCDQTAYHRLLGHFADHVSNF